MLTKIKSLLKNRDFISVATADLSGRPNAAPKFLLKIEDTVIHLIDYTKGRTWENLKNNPQVSLSFMDTESLHGYQINGNVAIIEKGLVYKAICQELLEKEIALSTKRILEGVTQEKAHQSFEVGISDEVVIFKITIEEIIEIGPSGEKKISKVDDLV
ncbi:MAG: pyridoxamine 5'-phosphate oxidase family protein [Candidatus Omnitrophica bacterium]|nr:pyridoxamine 5'-phosphate oxidase family protein [Candidatus Omnitrophota bacterium]